jgi:WD domain, G-beta repeat
VTARAGTLAMFTTRKSLLLTIGVVLALLGWLDHGARRDTRVAPPAAIDAEGTPLPPGAIARLGSARAWEGAVEHVGFSADGRRVAVLRRGGPSRWWHLAALRPLGPATWGDLFAGPKYDIYPPDEWRFYAPDRTTCLVWEGVGEKGEQRPSGFHFLDLATRRRRPLAVRHGGNCPAVAFTADGRFVAVGGERLSVCEVATGREVGSFPYSSVSALALSPDGRTVTFCNSGTTIHFGRVETGKEAEPLASHRGGISELAFSPDGRRLVSGSSDGTALVWAVPGPGARAGTRFTLSSDDARRLAARADDRGQPVPADARLTLELDKAEYFLGENVLLHFCVENAGRGLFHIQLGGDYHGVSRALRFHVEAIDEAGRLAPDPDPGGGGVCLGGIMCTSSLKPGDKHYESVPLASYRRIEKPGMYRLRVSHGLGWRWDDAGPHPVAEATLRFVLPTPEQARRVIEEMDRLPKGSGGISGERQKPFADFRALTHPVYLPVLAERAQGGDVRALDGIGSIPTADASAALIALLGHVDTKVARAALDRLLWRLPGPQLEGQLGPRNIFDNDHEEGRRELVKRSWDPRFAPRVLAHGKRLLDAGAPEDVKLGTFVLECLGGKEDVPTLVAALDRETRRDRDARDANGPHPRPRQLCQELQRACWSLLGRGAEISAEPRSPGEMLLFAAAVGERPSFRPPGWEGAYAQALRCEIPFVREAALFHLPCPAPAILLDRVAERLGDLNMNVQIAACRFAEKSKSAELREPVLRVLKTATDEDLFRAASTAAHTLCDRLEWVEVLVARLHEPAMAALCLWPLCTDLLSDFSAGSIPGREHLSPEEGRACKQVWEAFLRERQGELMAGRKYSLTDSSPPLAGLFPKFRFEPPSQR